MGRLTVRPDMTIDVYRGRKTTAQQAQKDISKTIEAYDLKLCQLIGCNE